jgi:MFS superfamily sulfate permease-like transporter
VSWPVFRSLRGYQRSWLRGDVVAGLTVWAVLVPEALAYASIAGVSPVVGLRRVAPVAPGSLVAVLVGFAEGRGRGGTAPRDMSDGRR